MCHEMGHAYGAFHFRLNPRICIYRNDEPALGEFTTYEGFCRYTPTSDFQNSCIGWGGAIAEYCDTNDGANRLSESKMYRYLLLHDTDIGTSDRLAIFSHNQNRRTFNTAFKIYMDHRKSFHNEVYAALDEYAQSGQERYYYTPSGWPTTSRRTRSSRVAEGLWRINGVGAA